MWLNVEGGYYISPMVHFDKFSDHTVFYIDNILRHIFYKNLDISR